MAAGAPASSQTAKQRPKQLARWQASLMAARACSLRGAAGRQAAFYSAGLPRLHAAAAALSALPPCRLPPPPSNQQGAHSLH